MKPKLPCYVEDTQTIALQEIREQHHRTNPPKEASLRGITGSDVGLKTPLAFNCESFVEYASTQGGVSKFWLALLTSLIASCWPSCEQERNEWYAGSADFSQEPWTGAPMRPFVWPRYFYAKEKQSYCTYAQPQVVGEKILPLGIAKDFASLLYLRKKKCSKERDNWNTMRQY